MCSGTAGGCKTQPHTLVPTQWALTESGQTQKGDCRTGAVGDSPEQASPRVSRTGGFQRLTGPWSGPGPALALPWPCPGTAHGSRGFHWGELGLCPQCYQAADSSSRRATVTGPESWSRYLAPRGLHLQVSRRRSTTSQAPRPRRSWGAQASPVPLLNDSRGPAGSSAQPSSGEDPQGPSIHVPIHAPPQLAQKGSHRLWSQVVSVMWRSSQGLCVLASPASRSDLGP